MLIFSLYLITIINLTLIEIRLTTSSSTEKYNNAIIGILNPLTIVAITPKTMDFTVELHIEIRWNYLDFNKSSLNKRCTHLEFCKIQKLDVEGTGIPEVHFSNCKNCDSHIMPEDDVYYNVTGENFVVWPRYTHTYICKFDLSKYPFDYQLCNIVIVAIKDIYNRYVEFSIEKTHRHSINKPPEYEIIDISASECNWNTSQIDSMAAACTKFEFLFQRIAGRHLLLIYLPSLLIVMMSWISFWISADNVGPRVALGVTPMLTLTTHFNNAQQNLPSISSLMALDIWMLFCILSVFTALFEYAIVYFNCLKRNEIQPITNDESEKNCSVVCHNMFNQEKNSPLLDRISRIMFPLTFIIFIIVYYILYCT